MRTMISRFLISMMFIFLLQPMLLTAEEYTDIECIASNGVNDGCFWIRGRYSVYNGSCVRRIWPVGTNRMLCVPDNYESKEEFFDKLFDEVYKTCGEGTSVNWDVFADFMVCPLQKDKPGHMRAVCLKSVKNIRVQCPPENQSVESITKKSTQTGR